MEVTFREKSLGMVIGCRESDGCAVVVTVKDGGAAAGLGVRPGMVVSRVNGNKTEDFDAVMSIVPTLPRPMKLYFEEGRAKKVNKPPPPPPRRKFSETNLGNTPSENKVIARSAVASRWEQMRAEHDEASSRKVLAVKENRRADIDSVTADSDVAERIRYFNDLFKKAVREAIAEAEALAERDKTTAAEERKRRRELLQAQWQSDLKHKKAPRPRFENVSGSPDQLVLALKSPAVRPENDDPRASKAAMKLQEIRQVRGDQLYYALVDVANIGIGSNCQKWIKYEKAIRLDQPGQYALIAKLVPGKRALSKEFLSSNDDHADRAVQLFREGAQSTDTGYDSDADSILYEQCEFESEISAAVFDLGLSPPLMQYEECDRELSFLPINKAGNRTCRKCGSPATATRRLYARGDYCICRTCALKGAGVLIDPGARRMWFSQMISFVGNRAIPLPRSQPLLTQILRVMQSHPGLSVRFEGHVNSNCLLSCNGKSPCPSAMCKTAPGGAFGLSTARADAVREFVIACGIEPDRVYAQGFAGTRRLTDNLDEEHGSINRRVECHTLLC